MADITGMLQAAAGVATEGWNLANTSISYVPYNNFVGNPYLGKTISVAAQASNPYGVAVSASGTKMWVLNSTGNLYQYTLSTPFEVSTATYDTVTDAQLTLMSTSLSDIKTYPDGQIFYFIDSTNNRILEYEASTGWDLSTLDFVSGEADPTGVGGMSRTVSVNAQETAPRGVAISGDGTRVFLVGTTNNNIIQYNLSTPFNITTASATTPTFALAPTISAFDIYVKADGLTAWIVSQALDIVYQIDLGTAWTVSTASFSTQPYDTDGLVYLNKFASVGAQSNLPNALYLKSDGTKLYVLDNSGNMYQYSLSTAWDASTATYDSVTKNFGALNWQSIYFKSDGLQGYMTSQALDIVYQIELSAAWDLSSASFSTQPYDTDGLVYLDKFASVGSQSTVPDGLYLKSDGTKLYVLDNTGNMYQYSLSTAWDVSTATYDSVTKNFGTFNVISCERFYFKSDGLQIYIVDQTLDCVVQFELASAWDLSSAIVNNGTGTVASSQYASKSFSVASQGTEPGAVRFKTDGTVMYVLSTTNDIIFQYTLSTPWDVSSASYASKSFDVSAQETLPTAMAFKPDGTKLYVTGTTGDDVNEYDLSTAWDISTASYVQNFSVAAQELNPTGIDFKPDGTKMYICGISGDDVNEYDLATPWNISTASFVRASAAVASISPRSVEFADDGKVMVLMDNSSDRFLQYRLGTAWNVSTAVFVGTVSVATQEANPLGMALGDGGKYAYAFGNNDVVYQYNVAKNFFVGSEETSPTGIDFKPDGTKMYICGTAGDDVNEYDLSVAWDVSTASYVQNFSVAGATDTPLAVQFSSDGSSMSVMGRQLAVATTRWIYKYDLATPWNISTAVLSSNIQRYSVYTQDTNLVGFVFGDNGKYTYLSGTTSDRVYQYQNVKSKYIGDQEATLTGIDFKPDGTKMYICGSTGDDVNEYNLSVAWDVSTASYVQLFSVATQTDTPLAVQFSSDGSSMSVMGRSPGAANRFIFKYDLATPWNISTAVVSSNIQRYNVYTQDTNQSGFVFGDNGKFVYLSGTTSDRVYQYQNVKSKYVGDQEATPTGIDFKPDGTKMYICGSTGDDVNEYDLSVAWDVTTASYVQNFSVAQTTNPTSVQFNSTGTIMTVLGIVTTAVYGLFRYTLSTPWDISTASFTWVSPSIQGFGEAVPQGFTYGDNGKYIFATGTSTDVIAQYAVAKALYIGNQETNARSMWFKPDGTKLYLIGVTGNDVNEYDLSVAWDINSASFVRVSSALSIGSIYSLTFNADGSVLSVFGSTSGAFRYYSLATPWNVSSLTNLVYTQSASTAGNNINGSFLTQDGKNFYFSNFTGDIVEQWPAAESFWVGNQEASPQGVFFKPDGTAMYIIGNSGIEVNQYSLSTPWDLTTVSFVRLFSVATQETSPTGIFFKDDGTAMYICGSTGDDVNEYFLTTPWNISTAAFVRLFSVATEETFPQDLFFKPDGTKMYIVGSTGDDVNEYDLSTAWNISTASYVQNFSVASQDTVPTGLAFKTDGTKMYIVGQINNKVFEYSLSNAWDISTASYTSVSWDLSEISCTGLAFKPDGTKMFVVGSGYDKVYAYNVGS